MNSTYNAQLDQAPEYIKVNVDGLFVRNYG